MSTDPVLEFQEKLISGKNIKLNFHTQFVKTFSSVLLYIKINTTEKDLLFSLGRKFKLEKFNPLGVNQNNRLFGCVVGENGIIFNCPENKIINLIIQYIIYLEKTVLKNGQYLTKDSKPGDYNKLSKSLENIDIYVYGKCKTFIKNCILKDEVPKMNNMIKSLESRNTKTRNSINPKENSIQLRKTINYENHLELMDLLMIYKDCDYLVNNKGKTVEIYTNQLTPFLVCDSDVVRNYLKSIRTMTGTFGTDDEKNKVILDQLNKIVNCFGDLHGLKFEFKNINEVKTLEGKHINFVMNSLK